MSYESGYQHTAPSTSGALRDIGGLVALSIVAMALLSFGHVSAQKNNASAVSQAAVQDNKPNLNSSAADQMSVPSQPRANGANTPAAPTTSTSGAGPSNGETR